MHLKVSIKTALCGLLIQALTACSLVFICAAHPLRAIRD